VCLGDETLQMCVDNATLGLEHPTVTPTHACTHTHTHKYNVF